ncbi:uncharacterized protein B0H18DRAFT_1018849 [Fomitopsis serialis]|uniref:uncharacterized protein n=1 Tax=Fomitopsis serialis TaxID=139415 RepID=UPI0020074F6D|nr:uncharacterized protein B0H18DRAFT_1018849 [Neoantrodia serialis]KAH9922048.1 hypothetical protein B0H18DRAFT_1018849 [Neoantrodia serialis]
MQCVRSALPRRVISVAHHGPVGGKIHECMSVTPSQPVTRRDSPHRGGWERGYEQTFVDRY